MRFAYSCNSSLSDAPTIMHTNNSLASDSTSHAQESALDAALQADNTACTDAPINAVISVSYTHLTLPTICSV